MKGCYEHFDATIEKLRGCERCGTRTACTMNSPEKAVKHNKGKTPWGLLLRDMEKELEEVVRVREYGAAKYSRDNWKLEKPDDDFFTDAAIRHILSYLGGQSTDKESSLPHLAHAICTLLMEMHHDRNGK